MKARTSDETAAISCSHLEERAENRESLDLLDFFATLNQKRNITNISRSGRTMVVIYTDGGCWPNPGAGGWGAVIRWPHGEVVELMGGENPSSNNRMELLAPISALEHLREPSTVTVYSDSEYVVKGITSWIAGWKAKGWLTKAKQPVKNRELWVRLDAARSRHAVTFEWVRGHSGIEGNERADALSQRGAQDAAGRAIDFSRFR